MVLQGRQTEKNFYFLRGDKMNKKILRSLPVAVIAFFLISFPANAQLTTGANYLGPSIGLSFLGSTPEYGINFEHSMKLKDFGTVGIGGIFRYWGYNESYFDGKWSYTNILIGAQGNYHFNTSGSKFDPWVGVILAYDAGSVSWSGPYGNYASPSTGGLWTAVQGGARYWLSPNLALAARIGLGTLGYDGLDVGVDFKL